MWCVQFIIVYCITLVRRTIHKQEELEELERFNRLHNESNGVNDVGKETVVS